MRRRREYRESLSSGFPLPRQIRRHPQFLTSPGTKRKLRPVHGEIFPIPLL
jgi:hypothetical protein